MIKMKKEDTVFAILILFLFYILPMFSKEQNYAVMLLLLVFPAAIFLLSLLYARVSRFQPLLILFVILAFIPAIFLFYNDTAWIYSIGFGGISLVGQGLGWAIRKNRVPKEERRKG